MLTYIILLGLGWLAEIAWLALDLELALRVMAAGALILHPIHEQRKGFRRAFNRAAYRPWSRQWRNAPSDYPLSRRQNALQAVALATVFPALALWGPWWAVLGIWMFYLADIAWTHTIKRVPGAWSAWLVLGLVSLAWAETGAVGDTFLWHVLLSMAAGLLLLALPWIMAYRRVRS